MKDKIDGSVIGWVNEQNFVDMDGLKMDVGWKDGQMAGWLDGSIVGWINDLMNELIWMDETPQGWM